MKCRWKTNKQALKSFYKNEVDINNELFEYVWDSMNVIKSSQGIASKKWIRDIKLLGLHKEDIIIFETLFSDYNLENISLNKKIIFPFNRVFISSSIPIEIEGEINFLNGFFLFRDSLDNTKLNTYGISEIPKTGERTLIFNQFSESELYFKNCLPFDIDGIELDQSSNSNEVIFSPEIYKCIRFILYKLAKKEYHSYKKWTPSGIIEKKIVYSSQVKSHKRHFWKDSGRFKIPLLSKEELISKGYGIDELVFRNNELRREVPYRIIDSFKTNEEKLDKKDNRIITLHEKRIWRSERKLYEILREIFPNEILRRHDRKTLKGLELDIYIRKLNLAFEYDGEQHFDKELCENVFKCDFEALQKRDKKKDHLCRQKYITLIRIKFDEPLNKSYIKKKIKEFKK